MIEKLIHIVAACLLCTSSLRETEREPSIAIVPNSEKPCPRDSS